MVDNGVDVSIAPNSSVILEPADSLAFRLEPQTAPQAVLTIRNVSDDRKIAFKVKTTRPMRYLVRPNQGMLGPNGTSSVMVILQQKDCEELLRLDPSERQLSNDKFLVQSIYVDDSFYELVKTKSTKEMADELTNMWAHTDKRSLSNKKLRCRFVQDEEGSMDAGAPSPIAPPLARYPSKGSLYSSSNNVLVQEVPLAGLASSSPSNDEKIATPAQLTSALLQETRPQDTAVHHVRETVSPNSASKESMQEVAALRKKYDELVAFTVQLTAQRDVLMSDLEKTRQLLQKTSSDAMRAKKLTEDSSTGLRQRKTGVTPGATNDDSHLSAGKGVKDPAAFGLFHLLVCAIIFFLIGRYY